MAAVDVGVAHDDDAVVAQLGDVEVVGADAGAERRDDVADLLGGERLVEARLLDVQDLAAQRQDRLERAVAALLGRAAGRVALDEVQLALLGVALLALGELAGQARAVEGALAAREVARLAGRLARARGVEDLLRRSACASCGFSSRKAPSCSLTRLSTMPLTSELPSLPLVWPSNCGFGTLTLMTAAQALARVLALEAPRPP